MKTFNISARSGCLRWGLHMYRGHDTRAIASSDRPRRRCQWMVLNIPEGECLDEDHLDEDPFAEDIDEEQEWIEQQERRGARRGFGILSDYGADWLA
jgi:hypothetical protein